MHKTTIAGFPIAKLQNFIENGVSFKEKFLSKETPLTKLNVYCLS